MTSDETQAAKDDAQKGVVDAAEDLVEAKEGVETAAAADTAEAVEEAETEEKAADDLPA